MKISHAKARQLIQTAGEQIPNPGDHAALEQHLKNCSQCAEYAGQLPQIERLLTDSLQRRWPGPALVGVGSHPGVANIHDRHGAFYRFDLSLRYRQFGYDAGYIPDLSGNQWRHGIRYYHGDRDIGVPRRGKGEGPGDKYGGGIHRTYRGAVFGRGLNRAPGVEEYILFQRGFVSGVFLPDTLEAKRGMVRGKRREIRYYRVGGLYCFYDITIVWFHRAGRIVGFSFRNRENNNRNTGLCFLHRGTYRCFILYMVGGQG